MKNLILLTILFLTFTFTARAQEQQCATLDDCNQKLSDAARMINKLIDVKKTDDKTFIDLQANVSALRAQIAEMERAKETPCSIASEKLKLDLTFWLDGYQSADKPKQKELRKVLRQTRKLGGRAVAAQCGITEKNWLVGFLETSAKFAPLLLFLK